MELVRVPLTVGRGAAPPGGCMIPFLSAPRSAAGPLVGYHRGPANPFAEERLHEQEAPARRDTYFQRA